MKLLVHGSAHLAALKNNKQEDKQSDSSVHESMYLTHHPVLNVFEVQPKVQGGSNMTGTDLYVNKPHCAAAVRP